MIELTAGEKANKALKDDTKYDGWDLASEWSKSILPEVWKCVDIHKPICPDKEFCVVMVYADDCLIKNCIRRKFYAWPWMPKPRPRQTVWLYRRDADDIQGLWCLPNAETMAHLATDTDIPKDYKNLAFWCRAYFNGNFAQEIRRAFNIKLQTEEEHNKPFLTDLVKSDPYNLIGEGPDAFDFSKPFTGSYDVTNSTKTVFK